MLKFVIISLLSQISLFGAQQDFETSNDRSTISVETIFSAYNDYKKGDIKSCESKLESIGLSNVQSSHEIIPKDIQIDTLVFHDTLSLKWVFFRSVDLGYLRNVNGFITIKAEDTEEMVNWIINKIQNTRTNLTMVTQKDLNKVILRDNTSYIVFDNRWKEETSSVFTSFYTYTITTFDDFVDITFEEIVPDNYIILGNKLAVKSEM